MGEKIAGGRKITGSAKRVRVVICGAGAIGLYLAAHLRHVDACLIARGDNLHRLQKEGLRLVGQDGEIRHAPQCFAMDEARRGARADIMILAMKSLDSWQACDDLAPWLHDDSIVLPAHNGIPWWYFYRWHGGAISTAGGHAFAPVDPGGRQWRALKARRVIGCVVYPACERLSANVVRHIADHRLSLGEPDGTCSKRLQEVARLLRGGGLQVRLRRDLRTEIWTKLLGNATFNPLAVLADKTLRQLVESAPWRARAAAIMGDIVKVGAASGIKIPVSIERRIEGSGALGDHRPSMLQDYHQSGLVLDRDGLLDAVKYFAKAHHVQTPALDALIDDLQALAKTSAPPG